MMEFRSIEHLKTSPSNNCCRNTNLDTPMCVVTVIQGRTSVFWIPKDFLSSLGQVKYKKHCNNIMAIPSLYSIVCYSQRGLEGTRKDITSYDG